MTNRLRELRLARRWSQEWLAYEVGVSRQTIHAIERGSNPSTELSLLIAEAFGLAVEDIFQRRATIPAM